MKLHIVILTKNEPEAFRLISRVCETKRSEDRVIIWDDLSGVGWRCMLNYYRQIYPLEYHQHAWNSSFCNHRNSVKPIIPEGEWVVMLDADEWIEPTFLQRVHIAIEEHPKADSFLISRVNGYYNHLSDSKMPEPDWSNVQAENWPDWQPRVFKNIPEICYVHDVFNWFSGCKCTLELSGEGVSLFHFKVRSWTNRYNHLIPHHA